VPDATSSSAVSNDGEQVMHRRVRLAFVLHTLVACPTAAIAQDDAFLRQQQREAAASTPGFSISFADDRRAFRPGEAIALRFTFAVPLIGKVSPFNYEHCSGLGIADAVLDHDDGTTDPQADYWNNGISRPVCGVLSGVLGGITGVEPTPYSFTVYLNQARRFESRGRYRVYVRSRHLRTDDGVEPAPLISNILSFEITRRDDRWEARTLAEAVRLIDTSPSPPDRTDAARVIAYLGTPAAVEVMAARYLRTAGVDGYEAALQFHWLRGLYRSRHPRVVVARLARELMRPERYVSDGFVQTLALVELRGSDRTRPVPPEAYEAKLRSLAARRLRLLSEQRTLAAHLERTFREAATGSLPLHGLAEGFPAFPAEVEAAFASLAPQQQQMVLASKRNWLSLRHPVFVPMLRRLALIPTPGGPHDLAARLLYELAPDQARALLLKAVADPDSRLTVTSLDVLPERELPAYDGPLASALERADSDDAFQAALARVERFGSAAIADRVQQAIDRVRPTLGCEAGPTVLAYFYRVAPGIADRYLGPVTEAVRTDANCYTGALEAAARRRMSPGLEAAAIGQLRSDDPRSVADAAEMLVEFGSGRAEPEVWQALDRWHTGSLPYVDGLRTAEDAATLSDQQALGATLQTTIVRGAGWIVDADTRSRLAALCLTPQCRESLNTEFDASPLDPAVWITLPDLPGGTPGYWISGRGRPRFGSLEGLRRWLSLQPAGTSFTLGGPTPIDVVGPVEFARHARELRQTFAAHGLRLVTPHAAQ
jgi:hypothetical protein